MTKRRVYEHTGRTWRCKGTPLALRRVRVAGAGVFDVPTHIVRIDSSKRRGATHGWQVRFKGTRMFSDGLYGGSAQRSLRAAKEFLTRVFVPPASPFPPLRSREAAGRKRVPLGVPGLSLRWAQKEKRNAKQLYIQVGVPVPVRGRKTLHRNVNIYVATDGTLTDGHLRRALQRAVDLRGRVDRLYQRGDSAKLKTITAREAPAEAAIARVRNIDVAAVMRKIRRLS